MHEAVSEQQGKGDHPMQDLKGEYQYELGCRWFFIRWKRRVWADNIEEAEAKGWRKCWFSSIETITRIY